MSIIFEHAAKLWCRGRRSEIIITCFKNKSMNWDVYCIELARSHSDNERDERAALKVRIGNIIH